MADNLCSGCNYDKDFCICVPEYYAGFTGADLDFLESIGRNIDGYANPEPDEFLRLLAEYGEDIDDWADWAVIVWQCPHDHRYRLASWLCLRTARIQYWWKACWA